MAAEDDLRLAWLAHREGRTGRRDALLTLAAAAAEPQGAAWVGSVRDHLVAARPGHLYAGFYHLDEALADRRVIAALAQLRLTFPPARVKGLLWRADAARGPYTGRAIPLAIALDDLLAASRTTSRTAAKLGSARMIAAAKPSPAPEVVVESRGPVLAFYLNVLVGIAALCAVVVAESSDEKRAA